MSSTSYPTPLVWFGVWESPTGINLEGFHVWNRLGQWHGVYKACTRAKSEAYLVRNLK